MKFDFSKILKFKADKKTKIIINIKDTCVLSVIGTVELFFATKSVAGTYYTYFEANTSEIDNTIESIKILWL